MNHSIIKSEITLFFFLKVSVYNMLEISPFHNYLKT